MLLFAANADNVISAEQQAFLQDAMVEAYGQEAVDEVKMQEKAKSQVLAELPEALLNCTFGESEEAQATLPSSFQAASCDDVISAAQEVGITQAQIEDAIGQLESEEDRMETLQGSLAQVYSEVEVEELEGDLKKIVDQLPDKFSNCRESDDGVDAWIPDIFQSPFM